MSTKDRSGEAFDRLRAADPAAGLEPDHAALRQAVAERATVVDELAVRRRRPMRALQVAAASAGALAIGAGGFALGGGFAASVVAGGAEDSTGGALPPITLESGARSAQEGAETGPSNADATGGGVGPAPMGGVEIGRGGEATGGMSDMAYLPGYPPGRTVFRQSGLSTSGGSATAYGYDAASIHNEATLRQLADALGVEGDVREEYGTLVIGSYDNENPTVSLHADGTASFNYNDPSKDVWFCGKLNDGACEERDLGNAPQDDEAIDEAREFLVTLGLDPASYEFAASDVADYGSTDYATVTAFRVVDGQRTGDAWGVSFTGAGIQSAWGSLASLVDLGEYSVVSPAEAVERLSDPRFGVSGSAYPPGWIGPAVAREGVVSDDFSVPPAASPGSSFDWPVANVTIISERLGLAQHYLSDRSVVLVPTYELAADDGRTWSVIAVADSHLDFTSN